MMGANQPQLEKSSAESQPSRLPFLLGAAMVIVAFMISINVHFSGEGDAPKLSPKDEKRLAKKLREIDDSEQYALVAIENGFYPCVHSGFKTYYLKAGEVWKYGVTTKKVAGRYESKFLVQNNVFYLVQFKGNIAECLKQEQIKLFMYPFLPENLARQPEFRLPRPPNNPRML